MTHPGRNDPCPCGSGKKYKKCCLAVVQDTDFTLRRMQKTHAEVIPRLIEFALAALGPELFYEAWLEFNDHQTDEPFDPESPMNMLFMPWLLFNWIVELKPPGRKKYVETTIAEMFLFNDLEYLTSDEQALLRTSTRCPYTLCEVTEVKPGVGMRLLDLLRRIEYEVVEHTASQTLKRGEIVYCATSEMWGIKSNVGMGPFALRPTAKRDVFDLRKWMIEQSQTEKITSVHLYEFELDIRGLYLKLLAGMFSPPQLANTDGDPMVPQKLYFELDSADTAFHALKSLAKGRTAKELLNRAEVKDGLVVRAEIEWLGGKPEARKRLGGPVLLGLLKIDHERMIVEVNSNKRATRVRRLIERRLGPAAKYQTTLIEPIESQVQEMWNDAASGAATPLENAIGGSNSFNSPYEEPELRAFMEESARHHWESWFDLPVPALNDMTPREAARTEEGRDLLESLLLLYAINDEKSPENYFKADISALRRELGLK
ncbi:MAG TPA: SEC-C metal-binding domain-containing protein [Pyrinomonadaceae bacterium]|nr:SEC-C metal-binding domain-containing protein [Pyrinomonadaceae bacterium]